MRKKSALTLFALAALPLTAQAQVTHIQTATLGANDKPLSLEIPKFNPGDGRLAGVRIDIKSTVSGSLNVENLDKVTRTAIAQAYFGTAVHGLEGQVLVFSPGDFNAVQRLHAYDGKTDYAGASGKMLAIEGSTPAVSLELMSAWADLTPFIAKGPGKEQQTLDLTAQSIGNFELHNVREAAAELDLEVRLTLRVTYLVLHPFDNGGELIDDEDIPDRASVNGAAPKFVKPAGPTKQGDRKDAQPSADPAAKPRNYGQKS